MMDDDAYREHVRSLRDALRSAPAHLYTHRDTSPERNAARQAIVDDAWSELGGDDIPKGRQGLILGGLPGSGKTQVRNSAEVPGVGPVASHFLPIDPDYFKGKLIDAGLAPSLPGFAPMETAPLMHKESNDLAKALARKAYGEGTNIAWDYSLRHPHSPDSRMAEFDHYGYTPHGIYVHADPAVALARTKKRHRDDLEAYLAGRHPHGGRYVPPEIIGDSVHGDRIANRDNYDRLARHLATSQVFDTTGGSQRTAMPYTPEEVAAIRSDRNHPNHYDLGNYHELPQNTPEEKESPRPEHLYRGIRVKGPVGPQEIQSIISNGLGSHWTSDIQNAAAFGDPDNHDEGHDYPGAANYPGPKNTGLIFTIRHPGAEHVISNPDGGHVNASYWNDEHEHSLAPDAPMHVVQVYMKSGPGQKFQPVNHRTASTDGVRYAARYYHFTDNPNFVVDPDYAPLAEHADHRSPGLWVAPEEHQDSWRFNRPYRVEFDGPDDLADDTEYQDNPFYDGEGLREVFVPADRLHLLKQRGVSRLASTDTAEYSSQPLNVRDNYTMADFFQWCAHNHKQPTTDNLAEFAAVSGMDTESYLDNYLFLSREAGLVRTAANKEQLYTLGQIAQMLTPGPNYRNLAKTMRAHLLNNDIPNPSYTSSTNAMLFTSDDLDRWDQWDRYRREHGGSGKKPLPPGWAQQFRTDDPITYIHNINDVARELAVPYNTASAWFRPNTQNWITSRPPEATHFVTGMYGSNVNLWSDLDPVMQWYKQWKADNPAGKTTPKQIDQLSEEFGGVAPVGPGLQLPNRKEPDGMPVVKSPPKAQDTTCPKCFTQHAGECL